MVGPIGASWIRPHRRSRVFCVGLAKSGTHSLVEMMSSACRVAHEPEAEDFLALLGPARRGEVASDGLRGFLREHDRRLKLDMEVSHLLSSFVPQLLDAFPDARFVLLVRDCRAWIDSMMNDQLNLREWEGYSRWRALYDAYLGPVPASAFPPEEALLRDLELYPLRHYVRFWNEEPRAVATAVGPDRLLTLRTERLNAEIPRLARFADVPASAITPLTTPSYPARRDHGVLGRLPEGYVEQVIAQWSKEPSAASTPALPAGPR